LEAVLAEIRQAGVEQSVVRGDVAPGALLLSPAEEKLL
jgi:hypothetical protein